MGRKRETVAGFALDASAADGPALTDIAKEHLGGRWQAHVLPGDEGGVLVLSEAPVAKPMAILARAALALGLAAEADVSFVDWPLPAGPEVRPLAQPSERDWALDAVGVPDVWRTHGVRGDGVKIGHPDTGYTRHPDVDDIRRRLILGADQDLIEPGRKPLDRLYEGPRLLRFLYHPGHGTATGARIVSADVPRATRPDDEDVLGAAPGACLIPYRVTRSVAIGWSGQQRRLAHAIGRAVNSGADVVSISLGFPFAYDTLRYYVDEALRRGVIVVAAAGQLGRGLPHPPLMAPGTLPGVVCVAASRRGDRRAKWSARGGAVAVTAPGQDIEIARARKSGMSWGLGDGTSYATAITAGVAALWVEKWRKRVPKRYRAVAFRNAIIASASSARPVKGGKAGRWGVGILDAPAIVGHQPPQYPAPLESEAFDPIPRRLRGAYPESWAWMAYAASADMHPRDLSPQGVAVARAQLDAALDVRAVAGADVRTVLRAANLTEVLSL